MPSQFTIFSSSMDGAPVLNGDTGSLVNVLNKILVYGFGTTLSAGWSLPYTSSNGSGSCYKMPGGTGFYLSVQDDNLIYWYPWEPRCRAFERATSWNSGSGQFPLSGVQGLNNLGYLQVRKANPLALPFTTKQWVAFVDSSTLYFFWISGLSAGAWDQCIVFGDIYSYKGSNDLYRCLHLSREVEAISNTCNLSVWSYPDSSIPAHYMARSWAGGGQSIAVGKVGGRNLHANITYMDGNVQYPNGPDNSIVLSPIWITEPTGKSIRGHMRGLYHVCHNYLNFAYGDTFEGSGSLAGKTFMIVGPWYCNGTIWITLAVETSNTVDTN